MLASSPFRRAAIGLGVAVMASQFASGAAQAQATSSIQIRPIEPVQAAQLQPLQPVQSAPLQPLRSIEPAPSVMPLTGIRALDVLMQRLDVHLSGLLVQNGTITPAEAEVLPMGSRVGPAFTLVSPGLPCRDVEVSAWRNNAQIGALVGVACEEPDGAWWLFSGQNRNR